MPPGSGDKKISKTGFGFKGEAKKFLMPIECGPHFSLSCRLLFFRAPPNSACLIAGKALRSAPDAVLVTWALK